MACRWSKIKKFRILAESGRIRPHLPDTRPFSREALDSFLDRYRRVVVKPTGGSGGQGVLFVTKKSCRKLRIVGFDIGVDRGGKPWIIEANFRPSKKLFKRLKDKTMYRRIMRYFRGRTGKWTV